jgi:hypothetical protein
VRVPARRDVDPAELRSAVLAVLDWLDGGDAPDRPVVAAAVRRVPPYVAVQCVVGPRHTRGTPPNVVETDPRTWLELVTGRTGFLAAEAAGRLTASGTRAGDIEHWLPILPG